MRGLHSAASLTLAAILAVGFAVASAPATAASNFSSGNGIRPTGTDGAAVIASWPGPSTADRGLAAGHRPSDSAPVCRTLNRAIVASADGSWIYWETGAVIDGGYHFDANFNPFAGSGNLSFYWAQSAINAGVIAGGDYAVLAQGTVIGAGSTFSSDANLAPAAWRAGADGYLGFRFPCTTATQCYGYAHMTTTGPSGYPATLIDYCFDPQGNDIAIPVTHTVTPSVGAAGGTLTPSAVQTVLDGQSVTFTLTVANPGFSIDSVGGSCGGTLSGNTFSTNPITADCTVIANFKPNGAGLTCQTLNHAILANGNGSWFYWEDGTVHDGDPAPPGAKFNAYEGYGKLYFYWPDWPANAGVMIGGDYAILIPGDVVGAGSIFNAYDDDQAIQWRTGADGYLGFRFACTEAAQCYGYAHLTTTGPSGYPATLVDYCYDRFGNAITIPGTPPSTHTVTASVGTPSGTITPSGPQTVARGTSTSFTLTADPGYEVDTVGGTCGGTRSGNSFTTNPVMRNCSVIVNFRSATSGSFICRTLNHELQGSFDGTSFSWESGAYVDGGSVADENFRAYVYGAMTFFWEAPTINAGLTLNGTFAVLGGGSVVGPSATFSKGSQPALWRAGANGYLGFRFACSTATLCYGYAHMITTGPGGYPATLVDYCFDRDGNAVTVPGSPITTHTVTPSVGAGNGSISPNTAQTVVDGDSVSFSLTPDTGFAIDSVGGTCGGTLNGNSYTSAAIHADCTVVANFSRISYAIAVSVDPAAGGSASCSPNPVNHGDDASCSASPNPGYRWNKWMGDCSGAICTLSNVTSDKAVTAHFIRTWTLTSSSSGHGAINPDGAQTLDEGATATFSLQPDTGYEIDNVGGSCGGTLNGNSYTSAAIHADCTVVANFKEIPWVVTASSLGHGTITPASQSVSSAGTASFTLAPDAGYHVAGVTGDTCTPVDDGGGSWSAANIQADCAVTATFAADWAAITAVAATPVGVVTLDPRPDADAKKSYYTWQTNGQQAEWVHVGFTVTAGSGLSAAGDLELEYFDTADNDWKPLALSFDAGLAQWTGALGLPGGFPLLDGAQSQLRTTFRRGGRYTTSASLIGESSGLTLATSAAVVTDVAELVLQPAPLSAAGVIGEAVVSSLRLANAGPAELGSTAPAPNDEDVLAQLTIDHASSLAPSDVLLEYWDGASWQPIGLGSDGDRLHGGFGPPSGFPTAAGYDATTLFRASFASFTGSYAISTQVVGVDSGTVYAESSQTVGIDTGAAAMIEVIGDDFGDGVVGGNVYSSNGDGSLRVVVKDSGGNPVQAASVAFNVPGTGASASLSAGTCTTDGSGECAVTANSNNVAGSFVAKASIAGGEFVEFDLANFADEEPSQIGLSRVSGDAQTAQVGSDYGLPLVAKVSDRFGNPLQGMEVTFVAPTSGASVTPTPVAGVTDVDGLTDSGTLTANFTAGAFALTASLDALDCGGGISTCSVSYGLTNTAAGAASVSLTSDASDATVGTTAAYTLTATVLDASSNAVPGVSVTLVGPSVGAGVSPALHAALTDASGRVTHSFNANTTAGGFDVQAVVSGVAPASVGLENLAGAAASIEYVSGDGQSTPVHAAFGSDLVVRVIDQYGNAVADDAAAVVTFTAPGSGASAVVDAAVSSSAGGLASAAATANGETGSYLVTASFNASSVGFALENTTGAVSITDIVWSDSGSSARAFDRSAQPATATVSGGYLASFSYNGSAAVPIDAGSYQVIATVDDGNVYGQASAMLTITPADVGNTGITLSGGSFGYDASAHPATVTNPNGVAYALAYDSADGLAPIDAGSWTATLTVSDPNYASETLTATIEIAQATGTVSFGELSFAFDGDPHATTAWIAEEPGSTCTLTESSGDYPRTHAGTTTLDASCVGANYAANGSANLVVQAKPVTIALSGLGSFPWDGLPHAATATVTGEVAGYPATVLITYDGDATAPAAVGSYAVLAELDPSVSDYTAAPVGGQIVIGVGPAANIAANGPVAFAGTAGEPLSGALPSVIVTDAGGHPVTGVAVNFTARPGSGTLSGATQTTDQNGTATLGGWILDPTPGGNQLSASAAGVVGTVEFTAEGEAAGSPLEVAISDGRLATQLGRRLTYTISIGNPGSSNLAGVQVEDLLPEELGGAQWQCIPVNAATCAASGTGDLVDSADLPAGSSVVYLLSATVIEDIDGLIANRVVVTHGSDVVTRSDHTEIVIFRDGFQLGGDGAEPWTLAPVKLRELGTLAAGSSLAVDREAMPLASMQRGVPAQARDGAFRIEALRIGKVLYLRIVAPGEQGETASVWSPLRGERFALVLAGARLALVGTEADLELRLARGGPFTLDAARSR